MEYIISALTGYIIGSVNPAYIFGKLHGFDIRERGTGNAGASNTYVLLGLPYAAAVALYDISKAIIAILIVSRIFNKARLLWIIAGCSAVVGHCFPFYLQFRGGKGFASFIGLSFMIDWKGCLAILAFGLLVAYIIKYIIFATTNQAVTFTAFMFLCGKFLIAECIVVLFTALVILYKHRLNYYRFFRGIEDDSKGGTIGIKLFKD